MSILVNNVNLISEYCITNKKQKGIIEKLFPGPFTAILKSKVDFAEGVTRNGNIAIRIPKNNTSISLAEKNPIIRISKVILVTRSWCKMDRYSPKTISAA